MFKIMLQQLRIAACAFVLLSVITGLLYPALITGIAQTLFPYQANGSMLARGSVLIGQPFDAMKYFWGRPSATAPFAYNAASSGGSNLGPTNPATLQTFQARAAALKRTDPSNSRVVPADLVMASGSGLDPEISPEAAQYQAARVAIARGLPLKTVEHLVAEHTQARQLGVLGEPRVNVLQLNLALDQLQHHE